MVDKSLQIIMEKLDNITEKLNVLEKKNKIFNIHTSVTNILFDKYKQILDTKGLPYLVEYCISNGIFTEKFAGNVYFTKTGELKYGFLRLTKDKDEEYFTDKYNLNHSLYTLLYSNMKKYVLEDLFGCYDNTTIQLFMNLIHNELKNKNDNDICDLYIKINGQL